MATWQFDIQIVPAARLANDADLAAVLDDPAPLWAGTSYADVRARLDALGPVRPTWSTGARMWGPDDGTCVVLWRDGDQVDSLSARIDLRAPDAGMIDGLLCACRDLGLVIIAWTGELIAPEREALAAAMMRSPAARFVGDPHAFLAALHRQRTRDPDT